MKKTCFFIATCTITVFLFVLSVVLAVEKCYQPSTQQKPCSSRPNEVSSCDTFAWTETVCKSKRWYTTPVDVPKTEVEADGGTTKTVKINCVKEYGCQWHVDQAFCYSEVVWDEVPFDKEDKIVVDPDVTCPPAG